MDAPGTLGGYVLKGLLGRGGMAEVYLAEKDGPGGFKKPTVVKRILPALAEDPKFVALFLREARLAARLNHPNIVHVYELGEDGGEYFLAMERIDGITLSRLARRAWATGQSVPLELVVRAVSEVALGLQHAQELVDDDGRPTGLVHRDISPDNLMVTREGVAKILDFGLAKDAASARLTQAGMLRGKVAYMPPEYIEGAGMDGRGDLYALGCVLYWLLSGRRPFEAATDPALMQKIVSEIAVEPRRLNPHVPPAMSDIAMRLLEKDPARRFQDGTSVHDALVEAVPPRGHATLKEFIRGIMAHTELDGRKLPNSPPEGLPACRSLASMTLGQPQNTDEMDTEPFRAVADVERAVMEPSQASVASLPTRPVVPARGLSPVLLATAGGFLAMVFMMGGAWWWSQRDHSPAVAVPAPAADAAPIPAPPPAPAPRVQPSVPAPADPVPSADTTEARTRTRRSEADAEPRATRAVRETDGTSEEIVPRSARGASGAVNVTAPPHIEWRSAKGQLLGKGKATFTPPASDAFIYAVDPQTSGKALVRLAQRTIDYSRLAHGTLTVKFGRGVKVELGKVPITRSGVPRKLVAGSYDLHVTIEGGEEEVHHIEVSGFGQREVTVGVTTQ